MEKGRTKKTKTKGGKEGRGKGGEEGCVTEKVVQVIFLHCSGARLWLGALLLRDEVVEQVVQIVVHGVRLSLL